MIELITNMEDIIDSRDVIDRIEWLEDERDGLGINDEEVDELDELQRLALEGDNLSNWLDGVTLIRDSYFKEYAQDYADDCGYLAGTQSWPYDCIDWDRAARELQMDFTSIEFDGITYWTR